MGILFYLGYKKGYPYFGPFCSCCTGRGRLRRRAERDSRVRHVRRALRTLMTFLLQAVNLSLPQVASLIGLKRIHMHSVAYQGHPRTRRAPTTWHCRYYSPESFANQRTVFCVVEVDSSCLWASLCLLDAPEFGQRHQLEVFTKASKIKCLDVTQSRNMAKRSRHAREHPAKPILLRTPCFRPASAWPEKVENSQGHPG